jgi:hypothetical protein
MGVDASRGRELRKVRTQRTVSAAAVDMRAGLIKARAENQSSSKLLPASLAVRDLA